jgi:tetratricopeptide (TPR) repeat protein
MGGGLITVVVLDVGPPPVCGPDPASPQGRALQAARERVGPYGGHELRTTSEALVAVFSTPRQAVSFAVAVQAAGGEQPCGRIGVTTGEALDTDRTINPLIEVAAALATRAGPGEVMVSDVVRFLAGSSPGVRFTDRGPLHLGPVASRAFATSTGEGRAGVAPVFGRPAELESVEWLLAELTGGSGRALIIEGEAGIGKTNLADLVAARARASGATVMHGRGEELEPDRPGRILLSLTGRSTSDVEADLAERARLGGSRGFALIESVLDVVDEAAATGPVVVVVEDLHWADELSLKGVAALGRRLAPIPVALVATLRPQPRPPLLGAVLAAVEVVDHRHHRLGQLDAVAIASLVASRTGAAPGPNLSSMLAGAAGNPLFVTELLRALADAGSLRVESGVVEASEHGVPPSLRATLVRRLSSLSPETMELLRLASLLGAEFSLGDLAVVANRSVVECATRLRDAVHAAALGGEGDLLSFRHDLIREAVYEDIAPAIRRDLHVAAGRALQAAGAPAQAVARHFARGARPGDVNAVEWLERAAHEAMAVDPGAAAALLERAISLAPAAWPELARLEAALLEPLAWSGRVDDARSLAEDLVDRALEPTDQFAARRGLGAVLATVGDVAAAAAECEAAADVPGAAAEQTRLLRCVAAGMSIITGGSPDTVAAVAGAALEDGERYADSPLACWAHQALALVGLATGHYDDALPHARASRRILDRVWVPPMGFLIPHAWEGSTLAYLDRFDDALAAYGAARRRAEARGETGLLVLVHAGTGGCTTWAVTGTKPCPRSKRAWRWPRTPGPRP